MLNSKRQRPSGYLLHRLPTAFVFRLVEREMNLTRASRKEYTSRSEMTTEGVRNGECRGQDVIGEGITRRAKISAEGKKWFIFAPNMVY